jgi:predicted nuclease with TOPRIM domain
MTIKKYYFHNWSTVTEEMLVLAESKEEAEKKFINNEVESTEVFDEWNNSDWELNRVEERCVYEATEKSKLNPTPFFDRLRNAYYKKDDTGINIIKPADNNLNADGVPITYDNKDVLSAEDLE